MILMLILKCRNLHYITTKVPSKYQRTDININAFSQPISGRIFLAKHNHQIPRSHVLSTWKIVACHHFHWPPILELIPRFPFIVENTINPAQPSSFLPNRSSQHIIRNQHRKIQKQTNQKEVVPCQTRRCTSDAIRYSCTRGIRSTCLAGNGGNGHPSNENLS